MSSVLKSENTANNYTTLLQTACVQVENGTKKIIARVLYDSASTKTFIRQDLAKKLNLKTLRKEKLCVYTFSNRNPVESEFDCVKLTLKSLRFPHNFINVEALITKEICGTQLYSNIDNNLIQNTLYDRYELADSFENKLPIQILLGGDALYQTLNGQLQKINKQLFVQPTIFGNTLVGRMPNDSRVNLAVCFNTYCSSTEKSLACLWGIESFLSNEEVKMTSDRLNTFENNLEFVNDRYKSPLLWKSEVMRENLCNNFEIASKRFSVLQSKFNANENLYVRYNEVMKEQLNEGIIEMCNEKCFIGYVMPHRDIYKESSISTKTRVVYDASSKQRNKYSLNDCLFSGENLNPNLVDIILKFREYKIAFCGDIARAFLQIQVAECDRNYLCFLYYKNCDKSQPVVLYHFNRHCFGVTCSPYVLAATIKTHLKLYEKSHPLAYEMLNNSLYVDDLFYGSSTVEAAFKLSVDAVSIFSDAKMTMRKFDTNSEELKNLWKRSNSLIETNENSDTHLKVLGLNWNNIEDTLSLNLNSLLTELDETCTKRNVLHTAARIFDPSGLISPFLIRIKCLLQELWQLGLEWDEEFSGELKQNWLKWCGEIKELNKLKIPRYYFSGLASIEKMQLHVFSDASIKAFGAVAYFRYQVSQDIFNTSFVISKARVAPLKKLTLPRLELMGAIVAARIVKHLGEIFKNIEKIIMWSDSTIVLHWVKGQPSKWKQFVSNRVTEIQEITDPSAWRHCIGKQNPADILTRGMSSKDLINSERWWYGPEFLSLPESQWPKNEMHSKNLPDVSEELSKKTALACVINTDEANKDPLLTLSKFSTLKRLYRVTSWIFRFISNIKVKSEERKFSELSSEELSNAEIYWLKQVQKECFPDVLKALNDKKKIPNESNLLQLNPILSEEGVLLVKGRLQQAKLEFHNKHPIVLPAKHKFTELIIKDAHEKVLHAAVSHTLIQIREKFWIIRGKQSVKSILNKCILCKRFNVRPGRQVIAPLPADRINESPPFSVTGLDFAGPLFVKNDDNKYYILLFTCSVTRAIHLELVRNMSTEEFLLGFRRFISRRGLCSVIYSDNAKSFKKADLQLKKMWNSINHPDVKKFYSSLGITWKYIVERAAWWGGFYERLVRTVKTALRKVIGKSTLTFSELETLLIEVEAMINSRPLTYVYSDLEEPFPLTPAHFLIGKRISSLPTVKLKYYCVPANKETLVKRFRLRETLLNHLWKRWKNEYLLNLRSALQSNQSKNSDFKVNDIVLVHDEHLPRTFWKLGKITKTFLGRDKNIRSCEVKTCSSLIKRPIQLLYNLELNDN